jgi:hypothetical protein
MVGNGIGQRQFVRHSSFELRHSAFAIRHSLAAANEPLMKGL